MNAKATVYLDPKILKSIKLKATHTGKTLSHLVNQALAISLQEDHTDNEAFENRLKETSRSL